MNVLFVMDVFPIRPISHQNWKLCAFLGRLRSVHVASKDAARRRLQRYCDILFEDVREGRVVQLVRVFDFKLFGHFEYGLNVAARTEVCSSIEFVPQIFRVP